MKLTEIQTLQDTIEYVGNLEALIVSVDLEHTRQGIHDVKAQKDIIDVIARLTTVVQSLHNRITLLEARENGTY